MKSQRVLWSCVVAVGIAVTLSAQAPSPAFEVASIRRQAAPPTPRDSESGPNVRPGGTFDGTHLTVARLIRFAYDLQPHEVVGGPDWVTGVWFEITARAAGDVPLDRMKLIVRSLLEDRFNLVAHREQRQMTLLALVMARNDRRPGPNLIPVADNCDPAAVTEARKRIRPPEPGPGGMAVGLCNSVSGLTVDASVQMHMPVIDRTGLDGKWVWQLFFSVPNTPNPSLPPFETAMQAQLGLKLERHRGPVDVLVIDSVQQPTEN